VIENKSKVKLKIKNRIRYRARSIPQEKRVQPVRKIIIADLNQKSRQF